MRQKRCWPFSWQQLVHPYQAAGNNSLLFEAGARSSDSNILFSITQLHLTSPSGPHSSCHSDYGGNSCAIIRILLSRPISVTAGCQLLHRQKHLLGIPSSLAFLLSPSSYPVLPATGVTWPPLSLQPPSQPTCPPILSLLSTFSDLFQSSHP